MTTATPDPVEACETPIADYMTARAQIAAENKAAFDAPTQITVAGFEAAMDAITSHFTWGHKPYRMNPDWSWECNCTAMGTAATKELMKREQAAHIVSAVLAAARVEVHRG